MTLISHTAATVFLGLVLLAPDDSKDQGDRDVRECTVIAQSMGGADHPSVLDSVRRCLIARGWVEKPIYEGRG